MKGSIFCLFAYVAIVSAKIGKEQRIADKDFLDRQKRVLELLNHVFEVTEYEQQAKAAKNFDFEKNIQKFKNEVAVRKFMDLYSKGYLRRGSIFSIFNKKQRDEATALFQVLYYAKDFETFYGVASWARQNINADMFTYSFTVAVLHHPELKGVKLPAPYEVNPYYFINSETISKAFFVKLQKGIYTVEEAEGYETYIRGDEYIIVTNRSSKYIRYNEESKLEYFRDDIGLNSLYFYFHADYPFWMGGEEYGLKDDRRGELFYYFHQQLLARYYLERLSNGFGKVEVISLFLPINTGYHCPLKHNTGLEFPSRPNHYLVERQEAGPKIQLTKDHAKKMEKALEQGFYELSTGEKLNFTIPEDIDMLGNFVQNNPDCHDTVFHPAHYYTRLLLGGGVEPFDDYHLYPSAMEHYETSLRDPVFWQVIKTMTDIFLAFKQTLKPYTTEELSFPGIKIENVAVGNLFTFFDKFDLDFTNAIFQNLQEHNNKKEEFIFKARHERLNHQPFTIKLEVSSQQHIKTVVRIFLGPKYDEKDEGYTLDSNHYNFIELDKFLYDLRSGKNSIERLSRDFHGVVKDWTPARDLYRHVMAGISGDEQFKLDRSEDHSGFPARLLLPRGRKGGFPYQLYFIISPWVAPKVEFGKGFDPVVSSGVGTGARYLDGRAFGYPFDRKIDSRLFNQPNMFWKDIHIYHKINHESSLLA